MEQSNAVFFHNAYINADSTELDRLWSEVAPKTLIKFYPATYKKDGRNHFLEHLRTRSLWLSSPAMFNDPFDSVINFDCRSQVEQWSRAILNLFVDEETAQAIMAMEGAKEALENEKTRFQDEIDRIHRKFENSIYTTCFTEKNNLRSLRMWGHYANSHAGVCAEYSFFDVNNASNFGCIPIKYSDSYEYLITTQNLAENSFNFLKLYTKSSEWQYEREWRVSQQRENYDGNGYSIKFVLPKRVYIGCKADDRLKNDVILECKKHGIELYQMTMRPGSFCLDITKLPTY